MNGHLEHAPTRTASGVVRPWMTGAVTTLRPAVYMMIAAACLAAVETVGGFVIRDMSTVQLVWSRYAIHLMLLLVVFAPKRGTAIVRSSNLGLQIVRSLMMLVMPLAFVLAVQYMPSNDVWTAYWFSPLTILVLGVLILHERAGPVRWTAGFVGLVAAVLIEHPNRGLLSPAIVLALCVGAAISAHLLLSRILRRDDPLASLFHTALWVFAALSLAVPFVWDPLSARNAAGVVFVAVAGMACLYYLARAGETAPLPVVATFAYSELIWVVAFNVVLYQVRPDKWTALGSLIVVGMISFMLFYEYRSATPELRPAEVRSARRSRTWLPPT